MFLLRDDIQQLGRVLNCREEYGKCDTNKTKSFFICCLVDVKVRMK